MTSHPKASGTRSATGRQREHAKRRRTGQDQAPIPALDDVAGCRRSNRGPRQGGLARRQPRRAGDTAGRLRAPAQPADALAREFGEWQIDIRPAGLGICLIFAHAYPRQFSQATGHHETFSPIGYTLDVLLPIVDLGQKSSWTPQGGAMYWSWALTGAGWVLVTAVIAGLTSVLKRD
jgi:hypothetical protein